MYTGSLIELVRAKTGGVLGRERWGKRGLATSGKWKKREGNWKSLGMDSWSSCLGRSPVRRGTDC